MYFFKQVETNGNAYRKLLEMAAVGGSLSAEAALRVGSEIPHPQTCGEISSFIEKVEAASREAKWSDEYGMAIHAISGRPGRATSLCYRSCGRFRAEAWGPNVIDIIIQAESLDEAEESARDRLATHKWRRESPLKAISVEEVAERGLGWMF